MVSPCANFVIISMLFVLLVDVLFVGCGVGCEPAVAVEAECGNSGAGCEVGEEVDVADRAVDVGGCCDSGEDADGEQCGGGEAPECRMFHCE